MIQLFPLRIMSVSKVRSQTRPEYALGPQQRGVKRPEISRSLVIKLLANSVLNIGTLQQDCRDIITTRVSHKERLHS